jgi:hypothetical protein
VLDSVQRRREYPIAVSLLAREQLGEVDAGKPVLPAWLLLIVPPLVITARRDPSTAAAAAHAAVEARAGNRRFGGTEGGTLGSLGIDVVSATRPVALRGVDDAPAVLVLELV